MLPCAPTLPPARLRADLGPIGVTPSPVRLSLPAQPRNIAVVRRALEAIAEELALPRRLIEDMRLAVTEACTNVVRHAYTEDEADGCERDAGRAAAGDGRDAT